MRGTMLAGTDAWLATARVPQCDRYCEAAAPESRVPLAAPRSSIRTTTPRVSCRRKWVTLLREKAAVALQEDKAV